MENIVRADEETGENWLARVRKVANIRLEDMRHSKAAV